MTNEFGWKKKVVIDSIKKKKTEKYIKNFLYVLKIIKKEGGTENKMINGISFAME